MLAIARRDLKSYFSSPIRVRLYRGPACIFGFYFLLVFWHTAFPIIFLPCMVRYLPGL